MSVTRLGIDGRDHPILSSAPSDPPLAGPVTGFDVLTSDQRQQSNRVGLSIGEHKPVIDQVLDRPHESVRVLNKFGHQPVPVGGVVPITRRAATSKIVLTHVHTSDLGDQFADPTDLGDQHRDRVLAGDRIIEHRRVQHSTLLPDDDTALIDHLANDVEDPFRTVGVLDLAAPQHQHRRMERLISQRQPARRFPSDVRRESFHRLTIRHALQRLQHHHRRHNVSRHRRTATPRPEQIGEHLIRKQALTMLSQKRVDRTRPHEMATQRCGIQKLTISDRRTLHPTIFSRANPKREHPDQIPRITQHAPSGNRRLLCNTVAHGCGAAYRTSTGSSSGQNRHTGSHAVDFN